MRLIRLCPQKLWYITQPGQGQVFVRQFLVIPYGGLTKLGSIPSMYRMLPGS